VELERSKSAQTYCLQVPFVNLNLAQRTSAEPRDRVPLNQLIVQGEAEARTVGDG